VHIVLYVVYTDLWIENRNVDVIVTDQRSQPVPHVGHLQQYCLYHVIVGYQFFSSGPVYDVGGPSQRDPVIGHRGLRFHRFQYLLFAIHHQTYARRHVSTKKCVSSWITFCFRFDFIIQYQPSLYFRIRII